MGVLAAYIEAQRSGKGQIVDVSMVEGAASLMTPTYGYLAAGSHIEEREKNRLDGGCHHYGVYETKDGEHICIGSNEPQFYELMIETVGLGKEKLPAQTDRAQWPAMRARLAAIFKTKTRGEWTAIMEQKDICFAPVLRMSEAPKHHQNVARGSFVTIDGVVQPGPAPKFSRTPSAVASPPAYAGQHSRAVLSEWGFSAPQIDALISSGAIKQR
jgi:alpha-methylacyl-CoA racemase